jgi:membrane-bound lytic murein transglycosylase B
VDEQEQAEPPGTQFGSSSGRPGREDARAVPLSCRGTYGVDYDGNGHVDLRHSVPDVLASTANLLKVNGWRAGAPFGEGTENFEVMREWNHAEIYRKAMVLFAQRLRE